MRTSRSRTLGLATALAAVTLGATALPAHAADAVHLDVPSALSLPAAPDSGAATAVQLIVNATGTTSGEGDLVITYDATGLSGIATFVPDGSWGQKCTAQGQVYTCTVHNYWNPQHPDLQYQFQPTLTAVKGAPQGLAGHLTISESWKGGAPVSADVAVYAGGPKLEFKGGLDNVTGVKPGSTVQPPLEVTNNGTLESGQLVLAAVLSPGMNFQQHYANCSYGTSRDSARPFGGTAAAICTVNTSVKPGQTVTVDPMALGLDADALYTDVQFTVSPNGTTGFEWMSRGYDFTPASGTGARLTVGLPESADAKPGPPNVSPYPQDSVIVQYTADSHADFAAHGAWAPTDGGKKGTLTVSAHNGGPASVGYLRSGEPIAAVLVQLPAGVTVAGGLPADCRPLTDKPDVLACNTGMWVPNGGDESFALPLAVADPAAGGKATISLTPAWEAWENKVQPLNFDSENANNTVSLALGSAPGHAGGTPSTGPSDQPTGGRSGTPASSGSPSAGVSRSASATPGATGSTTQNAYAGSGLASTGGGQGTGTLLGLGIGAVVLGGGVIAVTARRRRGTHS